MKLNLQKGFTLIELLVVIAIIGILSSVVFASLNTARTKGKVAAFKSEMDSFKKAAEIYGDDHNQLYTGLFDSSQNPIVTDSADPTILNLIKSIELKATDAKLYGVVSDNTYSLYALIPDTEIGTTSASQIWCIDNTGKSGNPTVDATNQFDTSDPNNIATVCW